MIKASQNFAFLRIHSRELVKLGTLAEYYFAIDPNTCMIKLRQYGEHLAQLIAASTRIDDDPTESQRDLLRRLEDKRAIAGQVLDLFHKLRKVGNQATHHGYSDPEAALDLLKYARSLGIWFHKSYGGAKDFVAPPLVPPANPLQDTAALQQELAKLREALQQSKVQFLEVTEQLEDTETAKEELAAQLSALKAQTAEKSQQQIQTIIQQAQQFADPETLDLDERATRKLIDEQLREVGWEVDSERLTYAQGVRPQKNRNVAIAEWPTGKNGRADYVLFLGLTVVGVVEAKRQRKDVYGAIDQAKTYSKTYEIKGEEVLVPGSPWQGYTVPFVFASNGRPYLKQLETKSGIWFCDLRRPSNLRKALPSWYSPDGLQGLLAQDLDQAHAQLQQEAFHYDFDLRHYQIEAIQAVETALAAGQREILLAMATGTGKTKTCIVLVYRLLKVKRFRRILFLVDRTALGDQATNAFKETRMESLQTFADIFGIKELKDSSPDRDTKVQVATVQSFVKRLLYPEDETPVVTVDQYDCIVVDECHRGYLLDRELSETELQFRDFEDYVSKYRRVLEHFDAVKIGLTATPVQNTVEIFGAPVYTYSYRAAVIDGWLIDHEAPYRIRTRLAEEGITWEEGEDLEFWDPQTGTTDLTLAPDEIRLEVAQFNKKVITESFNRVVCRCLAEEIDPSLPEKTLIFCATDEHADLVVVLLKDALAEQYGSVADEDVAKITGAVKNPLQMIRRFKNEEQPKIAVTVDLLTTGIDVPRICNLVFIRRVKSRILYEQMLGRATRLCPDIGKEVFRVFDAVDIYSTLEKVSTMKPVAVNPKISFGQLVAELDQVTDAEALTAIVDQFLAKLQRKRHRMTDQNRAAAETIAGVDLGEVADRLRALKDTAPAEAAAWLRERRQIAQILDRQEGGDNRIYISHHEDELIAVEQGYRAVEAGKPYGQRPEDYLESFKAYLETQSDRLAILNLITTRPRDLKRSDLRQLRLDLDAAGFSEADLQSAHRNARNEDIAASILGFIRGAMLNDELIPYPERVQRAVRKILMSQHWTKPQKQWLERIGKQMEQDYVVDKDALDQSPAFANKGGFKQLNKVFDGQLEAILADLHDAIWEEAG